MELQKKIELNFLTLIKRYTKTSYFFGFFKRINKLFLFNVKYFLVTKKLKKYKKKLQLKKILNKLIKFSLKNEMLKCKIKDRFLKFYYFYWNKVLYKKINIFKNAYLKQKKVIKYFNLRLILKLRKKFLPNKLKIWSWNLIYILFLTFRGLLSSKLLALYISKGLKMLSQHKRVLSFIKSSIEYFYNLYKNQFFLKIRGFKLSLKGRINGSTRFKTALMLYGQLNIPRFNNFIDYSYVPILTKYGILGLKIYLNKLVFNKKIYAIKTKKNKIFKFSQAFMKKKQKAFTLFTKISKY